MKLGLFVNDMATEKATYTTTRLALTAQRAGHEVWYIGAGDFAYDPDEQIHAHAYGPSKEGYESTDELIKDLQREDARRERITVDHLDALLLRNDPALDIIDRPWAYNVGIIFGQLAVRHGVTVLNDPFGLAKAMNKLYFQQFPESVRPKTLITHERKDVKAFVKEYGTAVLKPLQGSGGQSVFLVRNDDQKNLNQMIDAVSRDGYVICQEYLAAAEEGDTRLFVMNGVPLQHEGKYAAFQRKNSGGDLRSNMHSGGEAAAAEISDTLLEIADVVRPKLVSDGMFLVGLDVAGDKLMEINVFSPGGLGSAQKFAGVDFAPIVLDAIERKVQYVKNYPHDFDNTRVAML